jgi:peptide deformylase
MLKTPPAEWDFSNTTPEDAAKLALILIESSDALQGAGLSANQIGINQKAFAITLVDTPKYVAFNPVIEESSEEVVLMEEGCLSRPGLWLKVARPKMVRVKYMNAIGEEVRAELDGYHSRVFQHEYDHMLGMDFTQRVSSLKLQMGLKKLKKRK